MCKLVNGLPAKASLHAAHNCGNAGCVNPKHLRWATNAENQADKEIHGTVAHGEAIGLAKLTEDAVREIRCLSAVLTQQDIAKRFCVAQATVWGVIHRKTWKRVV